MNNLHRGSSTFFTTGLNTTKLRKAAATTLHGHNVGEAKVAAAMNHSVRIHQDVYDHQISSTQGARDVHEALMQVVAPDGNGEEWTTTDV